MRKCYLKPKSQVVIINSRVQLLSSSSPVSSVNTNFNDDDDFEYVGGSSVEAR